MFLVQVWPPWRPNAPPFGAKRSCSGGRGRSDGLCGSLTESSSIARITCPPGRLSKLPLRRLFATAWVALNDICILYYRILFEVAISIRSACDEATDSLDVCSHRYSSNSSFSQKAQEIRRLRRASYHSRKELLP